jgi:hypothetical protein
MKCMCNYLEKLCLKRSLIVKGSQMNWKLLLLILAYSLEVSAMQLAMPHYIHEVDIIALEQKLTGERRKECIRQFHALKKAKKLLYVAADRPTYLVQADDILYHEVGYTLNVPLGALERVINNLSMLNIDELKRLLNIDELKRLGVDTSDLDSTQQN